MTARRNACLSRLAPVLLLFRSPALHVLSRLLLPRLFYIQPPCRNLRHTQVHKLPQEMYTLCVSMWDTGIHTRTRAFMQRERQWVCLTWRPREHPRKSPYAFHSYTKLVRASLWAVTMTLDLGKKLQETRLDYENEAKEYTKKSEYQIYIVTLAEMKRPANLLFVEKFSRDSM